MIEWLRSFFFNAGVFKGTVRGVLIGVGIVGASISAASGLPVWVTAIAGSAAALGGFIRSTQHVPDRRRKWSTIEREKRKPSPGEAPAPPADPPQT